MHAVSGTAAIEACRLLALECADIRRHHHTIGITTLEFGTRDSAHTIREARDVRATNDGIESSAGSKGICRKH